MAYAHIKQGKLGPWAKRYIFLGYPHGVKGYKLWSLEQGDRKCFVSRDVTFNEELMPWKDFQPNNVETESKGFEIELQNLSFETENSDNRASTSETYEEPT